jgi:hypothetical protein
MAEGLKEIYLSASEKTQEDSVGISERKKKDYKLRLQYIVTNVFLSWGS